MILYYIDFIFKSKDFNMINWLHRFQMGCQFKSLHVENYRFVAGRDERSVWKVVIEASVAIKCYHVNFRIDNTGFSVTNKSMGRYGTHDR